LDARERNAAELMERRLNVSRRLSFMSPGTLFLEAAADLAGTGTLAGRRVSHEAEQYQDRLEAVLFDHGPRLRLRVPATGGGIASEVLDRRPLPSVAALPQFTPSAPTPSQRIADAALPVAGLATYGVIFWTFSLAFFRYDRIGRYRNDL
jgi:hypothetical protein